MTDEISSVPGFAKESDRIQRARQKLLARWDEEAKFINTASLNEVKEKIKNQYHRNTSIRTRIETADKPLRLFAQGEGVQLTAGPKVREVMKRVQNEFDQQREILDKYFPPMTIKPLDTES